MKGFSWLLPVVLTAAQTIDFDSAKPGALPPGWTTAMTHAGAPPRWEIRRDRSAPSPPQVFAQISNDRTEGRFPLAILGKSVKDGEVSVKLKPVTGTEDRAGGLVWRYRDPNNYYLVRANALENNIVLYKVENGRRMQVDSVKHPVPANQWSVLKVQFRGPRFSVYFNHRRLFQTEDTTFAQPGQVGLWTKADSVTYFDDFRVAGK
jgi:hypothetical protein